MGEFDILTAIAGNSPAMAFGLAVLWFSRRDHADMLRREQQFSESLAATMKEYLALQRETVESNIKLERQIHELKNATQKLVFEVQRISSVLVPGGKSQ